jgi:hypothetical protein
MPRNSSSRPGDQDAVHRPAGDRLQVLRAGRAGLDQPVRPGTGDVAADGWRGDDADVRDQPDLDRAEDDHGLVQRPVERLVGEDQDRERGAEHHPDPGLEPEEVLQPLPGRAEVADAEDQPTEGDQAGQHVSGAGDDLVGEVLGTEAGQPDHPPDVQLDRDVDDDAGDERRRRTRRSGR